METVSSRYAYRLRDNILHLSLKTLQHIHTQAKTTRLPYYLNYGASIEAMPPVRYSRPSRDSNNFLHWNRFLLDDLTPSRRQCAYREYRSPIVPDFIGSDPNNFKSICLHASIGILLTISEQNLLDGNHRTTILEFLDQLASHGWVYKAHPFEMYIIITTNSDNRLDHSTHQPKLQQHLLKKVKKRPSTFNSNKLMAEEVKDIPIILGTLQSYHQRFNDSSLSLDRRREEYCNFRKNENFIWFRMLYPSFYIL